MQMLSTPLPTLAEAREFHWGQSYARLRNVHGFNSMDARSRSFNLIRGRLASLRIQRDWRMLGVVSATPNVGKSFVAANLAAALSRDPRFCTYLVDLDLRRGAIMEIFGMDCSDGLSEYLTEKGATQPPAYRPAGQDLVIIPTNAGQVHSAELLASERCANFLRAMRASDPKNLFLFDLPPVFANDDAATAMEFLEGYVVIAEEGKTSQREVESTVEMLGQERLAGVILNKYRGGLVSEGRGIEERYAGGYYEGDTGNDLS
jgi:Mrp family chromosome partitioning ATPase